MNGLKSSTLFGIFFALLGTAFFFFFSIPNSFFVILFPLLIIAYMTSRMITQFSGSTAKQHLFYTLVSPACFGFAFIAWLVVIQLGPAAGQ